MSSSNVKKSKKKNIEAHWWRKSFAGVVLGFFLSLALIGIFAWAGPGGIYATDKVQFNMWALTILWLCIMSLVYLFRTGNQAILWLGLANALAWPLLLLVRGG